MELTEAIRKRRSVRKFTDYSVTDDEITELLEAARWAPSWANTQVWEFIVVRDKGLIEKVAETYAEKNPAYKCTLAASVLIVACAKTGISGTKGDGEATKFTNWFMFDVGMAVQNISLRAHELGLGTVVVGLMDQDACRKVLSVPEGYEVVVVLPVGQPAVSAKEGPPRKEQKEFVHLNTFGNLFTA
jgi:nitroreductase